jgi:hypothetical protein
MDFSTSPFIMAAAVFLDREREARVTLRFPFSLGITAVTAAALDAFGRVQAVSDAVLKEVKFTVKIGVAGDSFGRDNVAIQTAVGLFYRNAGEYDALYIPAPSPWLFEAVGPYAGIRVDTLDAPTVAALADLNLALETAGAFNTHPLGPGFLAGGRVL